MSSVSQFCTDRKNQYDTKPELEVADILNKNLGTELTFRKNTNIYDYDLTVCTTDTKLFLGYVEIERSTTWITFWPAYWRKLRFLARKIYEFDYINNQFHQPYQPRKNSNKTVYLYLNQLMTDCYCQSIDFIVKNFTLSVDNTPNMVELPLRNRTFLQTDLRNNYLVYRGWNDCFNFIKNFFNNLKGKTL